MSASAYEELLEKAGKLPATEQLRLLEALAALVRQQLGPSEDRAEGRSILELEGLGQHVWRDERTGELMDAQEYVNLERSSWRG